jgi:hypothetical protein
MLVIAARPSQVYVALSSFLFAPPSETKTEQTESEKRK